MENRSQMQRYQDGCFARAVEEIRNLNPQTDADLSEILDRIRAEIVPPYAARAPRRRPLR